MTFATTADSESGRFRSGQKWILFSLHKSWLWSLLQHVLEAVVLLTCHLPSRCARPLHKPRLWSSKIQCYWTFFRPWCCGLGGSSSSSESLRTSPCTPRWRLFLATWGECTRTWVDLACNMGIERLSSFRTVCKSKMTCLTVCDLRDCLHDLRDCLWPAWLFVTCVTVCDLRDCLHDLRDYLWLVWLFVNVDDFRDCLYNCRDYLQMVNNSCEYLRIWVSYLLTLRYMRMHV